MGCKLNVYTLHEGQILNTGKITCYIEGEGIGGRVTAPMTRLILQVYDKNYEVDFIQYCGPKRL